jgi:hypothetical protein
MRNKILLITVLFVSAVWAVAQQDSSQQSAPPSSSSPSTQSSPSTSSPSSTTPDAQSSQSPSSQSPSSQSPSSMPSQNPSSSMGTPAAAGNTIEGCLGGSAGKFNIIDKAGMTYDLVLPQGADTSKLGQHVGQEVAVTGTMSNPGGAGSPSTSPSSATSAGAGASAGGHGSIQVTKIDKVSDTCSTNPGGATGAKPPSQ